MSINGGSKTAKPYANGDSHKAPARKYKETFEVVDAPESYPGRRDEPHITWFAAVSTYFTFILVIIIGHLRDYVGRITRRSRYVAGEIEEGYAPLFKSWENFYTRRLYHRIQDCWNRPICGPPGGRIEIMERCSDDNMKTLRLTDTTRPGVLNLGSYNYLGFADDWQQTCKKDVLPVLKDFPVSMATSRHAYGSTTEHLKLEKLVARFVGKEDAVVFNMGYGTNATVLPALLGRGSLVVSDSLNHMSIVSGCRASGALIRVFKHNDAADLEAVLREAIVMGMPRTRRAWKKILVMVEGIYSMEGEICDLKGIVAVAKRYKAYVYLDEAHSIGALGKTGRGACEYCGVPPADVDILMGTFTKSFGGMGGYIAGDRALIDHLRANCAGLAYHGALSPVVARQVHTALKVIMGEDGTDFGAKKLAALRENANYVRRRLEDAGAHVLGDYNSPVIPLLIYVPAKIAAFSLECYARGMAVVVVGFPATALMAARSRICVSAGHSREDLEEAVAKLKDVIEWCYLAYNKNAFGGSLLKGLFDEEE